VSRVHIVLEEVAALRTIISEIQEKQNNKEDSKSSGRIDNINDFLGKQQSWLKEKFRACSTGALNHSTVETHLKDYPGLRMAVSTFSSVTQSDINMEEYMDKYTEWVKAGLKHAANQGAGLAVCHNNPYFEYSSPPPKMEPTQQNSSNNVSESIPQKKEFRLVHKRTTYSLTAFKAMNPYTQQEEGAIVRMRHPLTLPLDDLDIWTLEPVD